MTTTEFLSYFPGRIWLQTFPDDKVLKTKKTDLAQCFSGYDARIDKALQALNRQGCGIYFCVNELKAEAKERSNENIENIRAFFLDLDGAPLQPVFDFALLPSLIVRTSEDRFHAYWCFDKVPADRENFRETQKKIAEKFNGDRSINDLCRVMRLPGFKNMKGEPFNVTWAKVDGYNSAEEIMRRLS